MSAVNHKNEESSSSRRRMTIVAALIVIAVLVVASFGLFGLLRQPTLPKAAIIDPLSSSFLPLAVRHENQTFIAEVKQLLSGRFSQVDYYSENATAEQYMRLASQGYRLILWRAHSAVNLDEKYIAIATSETFTIGKYEQYLGNGWLTLFNITGSSDVYYGITPKFVQEAMSGHFEDTVMVLASCNVLKQGYLKTADAFVAKGVKVFISWDGWIELVANDNAMSVLLNGLITGNMTVGSAISSIPEQRSQFFGSSWLRYYPEENEVAGYRVPDYRQNVPTGSSLLIAALIGKKRIR